MDQEKINKLKKDVIAIGRLLWDKELASGLNGNISVRVDESTILLTATRTCLGLLKEEDILLMKVNGELIDEGSVSTENTLHTEIYKNFADTQAVIHTHTTYVNGYFLENDKFNSRILETKLFLGEVRSIRQDTPAVTEFEPVIDELKGNNIVVLKNHGALAMGRDLFDCFLLVQGLENAIKVDAVSRLYKCGITNNTEIKV
ncbi:MAG: class II aldolase/adducin family protein, partial [Candidatus Omnitrophica bacterium]|nr:class II aldolase/adducin family protein [Candidatus Omnitrophota bacterium]